jgi:dihydrofolate reductase
LLPIVAKERQGNTEHGIQNTECRIENRALASGFQMTIISAMTGDRVIGRDNDMPWRIRDEFAHFKRSTMGGTLIVGRATWDSMGGRPLKGRKMIVLSRSLKAADVAEDVRVCRTMDEAVEEAEKDGGEVFFAGGVAVYEEGLKRARRMLLSIVKGIYEGDTYFPAWDPQAWDLVREEPHDEWTLQEYGRKSGS